MLNALALMKSKILSLLKNSFIARSLDSLLKYMNIDCKISNFEDDVLVYDKLYIFKYRLFFSTYCYMK